MSNDETRRGLSSDNDYEVFTISVQEDAGLRLAEGSQAFYQRSVSRQQYGTWHYFVILRPKGAVDV